MTTSIPTDPNPFHHAAALIQGMDCHDLEALTKLIEERRQELNSAKPSLRWVSLDGGNSIAKGKRGTYRIMRFMAAEGHAYCLTLDAFGTHSHIKTHLIRDHLKEVAAEYERRKYSIEA
jgi:hypothetical protein